MPKNVLLSQWIYKILLFLILGIGAGCFGAIVILLLFFSDVQYPVKVDNYISNAALLVPVAFLCIAAVVWTRRQSGGVKAFDRAVAVSIPVLFVLQLFVFYQIYFESGWDAAVVANAARAIVSHDTAALNDVSGWYFSRYPNNLFLTWIISITLHLNEGLRLFDREHELMLMVVVNSALALGTSVLVYKTLSLLGAARKIAFLGYWLSVVMVSFSPWNVIVYSDALGAVFPLLVLYLGLRKDIPQLFQWPLVAGIAYIGYLIKPTVFIVLIALVGVHLLKALYQLCQGFRIQWTNVRRKSTALFLAVATIMVIHVALDCTYKVVGLTVDENQRFSIYHFLKMGQNNETNGGYNADDVNFSGSFSDYEERKEADKDGAFQRIRERGLGGQIVFTARKVLSDYNDGSFSWAMEGGFYKELKPEPSAVAGMLREVFYSTGRYYPAFKVITHGIWWGTILLVLFSAAAALYDLLKRKRYSAAYLVLLSSLIGVTLYDAIFETRARYLYIFVPLYILCGMLAIQKLARPGFMPGEEEKIPEGQPQGQAAK